MDAIAPAPPPAPRKQPRKTRLIDRDGHPGVAREDVSAVGSIAYQKLYKKREPIYPKQVEGVFRRAKWIALVAMLAIYYVTPWIRFDRGPGRPDQFAMVDFAGRRFWFGPIELWPQEVFYITGLLILAALGIFLASALFGRVWCGYACPQTVWTDLYLFVERRIEGDRSAQIRLAKAPWGVAKIAKKAAKHAIWILIAAATGGAWVFYFGDAPTLFREIFSGAASTPVYGFVGLLTFTTYALAGTMREQVCTYMCPWPRIQAAMMDPQTLSVTYRKDRGEPRGPHKKGAPWEGRGDCVDCNQCVAACPQGIDIREGFQLECINCALCVDACDAVMGKVGRPKGLIAYDTDLNIERRARGELARFDFVRPRTVFYVAVMILVAGAMTAAMATRQTLQLNVIRDRNPAFVRLSDGSARNGYTLKIVNMAPDPRVAEIRVEGAPGATVLGLDGSLSAGVLTVPLTPDAVTEAKLYVALPPDALSQSQIPIAITVRADDGATARNTTTFLTGEHE